jgi:hypothetical protein
VEDDPMKKTRLLAFAVLGITFTSPVVVEAQNSNSIPNYLLFIGETFLGCLNCVARDPISVCNPCGDYGNPSSWTSIWNSIEFSEFAEISPWNDFGSNPPEIMDHSGKCYGYLAANRFNLDRTTARAFLNLVEGGDTRQNRNRWCASLG